MQEKEMYTFRDLVEITETLRGPKGCPWDKEQTLESLKQYLKNESEEVFEAVDSGDMENLCEELGDVLFQVMINSQVAKEMGAFSIDDVVDGICRKMVRRHPHVFGDVKVNSVQEGNALWNEIKMQEKAKKP
jgi:tetrapyrrole methylase family protein/MazG family protein